MKNQSTGFLGHVLLLNLAMLCIATSGPLGRAVAMKPILVIFWRAGLAFVVFSLILQFQKVIKQQVLSRDRWLMLGGGVLIAIHWVTYFVALQLSSVAIGMLSLFTYPVMTAILEPIILKTRFQWAHLLLGALTILGIYFLAPSFNIHDQQFQALGWGLISAFTYALRNILMKPLVQTYSGTQIMRYHMLAVFLVLAPACAYYGTGDITGQWPFILALALVTTALGHTLFLQSFRHFSITTASIFSAVQPVYGIILAAIFLREYPTWETYLGGGIILLAVLIESARVRR
ncbi:MAG: DMT family transporter [Bacteroidota bacterium]